MKEDESNKSSLANTLNKATYEDETTQDDNSMYTNFF